MGRNTDADGFSSHQVCAGKVCEVSPGKSEGRRAVLIDIMSYLMDTARVWWLHLTSHCFPREEGPSSNWDNVGGARPEAEQVRQVESQDGCRKIWLATFRELIDNQFE